jgi:hypothetical protein
MTSYFYPFPLPFDFGCVPRSSEVGLSLELYIIVPLFLLTLSAFFVYYVTSGPLCLLAV